MKHIYLSVITYEASEPSLASVLLPIITRYIENACYTKRDAISPRNYTMFRKITRSQTGRFVFAPIRRVFLLNTKLILVSGHRINLAHRLFAITSTRSRVHRARIFESAVYRVDNISTHAKQRDTPARFVFSSHGIAKFHAVRSSGRDAPVDTHDAQHPRLRA